MRWYATGHPTLCHGKEGAVAIRTGNRAEWLCSGCGEDVSLFVVLLYRALQGVADSDPEDVDLPHA